MVRITEARDLARQSKNAINELLQDDTADSQKYRLLAARLPKIVEHLTDEIKTREKRAKELRRANKKQVEAITECNERVLYLEAQLEKGGVEFHDE